MELKIKETVVFQLHYFYWKYHAVEILIEMLTEFFLTMRNYLITFLINTKIN